MDITIHMMVRNEENWIWFAVMSALDSGGRVMVWDTGSEDRTLQLVSLANDERLDVRLMPATSDKLVEVRNLMLQNTSTEWFAIVDGDEVWPKPLWHDVQSLTRDPDCDVIVVPACYPFPWLGATNIEASDAFEIAGVRGPYAARIFRRTSELRWRGEFGDDGLFRADGTPLTRGHLKCMRVASVPFWHLTLLPRSSLDADTFWRHEKAHIDEPTDVKLAHISRDDLPDVFRCSRPDSVQDPFCHAVAGFSRPT